MNLPSDKIMILFFPLDKTNVWSRLIHHLLPLYGKTRHNIHCALMVNGDIYEMTAKGPFITPMQDYEQVPTHAIDVTDFVFEPVIIERIAVIGHCNCRFDNWNFVKALFKQNFYGCTWCVNMAIDTKWKNIPMTADEFLLLALSGDMWYNSAVVKDVTDEYYRAYNERTNSPIVE